MPFVDNNKKPRLNIWRFLVLSRLTLPSMNFPSMNKDTQFFFPHSRFCRLTTSPRSFGPPHSSHLFVYGRPIESLFNP